MKEARWFRLAVLAILTSLVFVGCGGGSDDGDDGGDSETVPVAEYVEGLCSAMVDWQGQAQELATTLQTDIQANQDLPIPDRKEKLTTYLADLKTATEDFIANVEEAGVPDVEGGSDVADNFLSGFRQLVGVIETAEEQIPDLPEDSPAAFQAATDELGNQLQSGFEGIGTSFEQMGQTPLDPAFEDEESCQQIQTGA